MYICILANKSDVEGDVDGLSSYMNGYRWKQHVVHPVDVEKQVRELIDEGVDVFINFYDGTMDDVISGLALVEVLEKYAVAFTGADSKFYDPTREAMKRAAADASIPTPNWMFTSRVEDVETLVGCLRFPMIVKPPQGYASVGINRNSRVENKEELLVQVQNGINTFGRVLIEEFIEGREFTCLVAENPDDPKQPFTFAPVEFIFPPGESFKHYDMKWFEYKKMTVTVVCDERVNQALRDQAYRMFMELGGNGYARCDYRMDANGVIYMLEINPNCGIFYPPPDVGSADFSILNDPLMDHAEFLRTMIRCAQLRQGRLVVESPSVPMELGNNVGRSS